MLVWDLRLAHRTTIPVHRPSPGTASTPRPGRYQQSQAWPHYTIVKMCCEVHREDLHWAGGVGPSMSGSSHLGFGRKPACQWYSRLVLWVAVTIWHIRDTFWQIPGLVLIVLITPGSVSTALQLSFYQGLSKQNFCVILPDACAYELRTSTSVRIRTQLGTTGNIQHKATGSTTSHTLKARMGLGTPGPQRAQYTLIKEYSLNHNMKPLMI